MWTGTRSSRFYVVELKDQLWAGSSHIGLVWFWDICLGLPVQVYALGGFMVLSWLWGRWKERRDRRASPWGLSSSMSPGGDCSIIPSLQLAFPSPSSLLLDTSSSKVVVCLISSRAFDPPWILRLVDGRGKDMAVFWLLLIVVHGILRPASS